MLDNKQSGYYIACGDNEYYKVISTIEYAINKEANIDPNSGWSDNLKILKEELEQNHGNNILPWQYNMIIKILLEFVPDEIKNKLHT